MAKVAPCKSLHRKPPNYPFLSTSLPLHCILPIQHVVTDAVSRMVQINRLLGSGIAEQEFMDSYLSLDWREAPSKQVICAALLQISTIWIRMDRGTPTQQLQHE